MKLEDQVCSLELAKRLKELGVKQESAFSWMECSGDTSLQFCPIKHWADGNRDINPYVEVCRAFTVAELGEMLPPLTQSTRSDQSGMWLCYFEIDFIATEETEANARAKVLVFLIEKGIVKI